jgi:hypothetical protein
MSDEDKPSRGNGVSPRGADREKDTEGGMMSKIGDWLKRDLRFRFVAILVGLWVLNVICTFSHLVPRVLSPN